MSEIRTLPNQLGIIGWLRSGRRGVEGYVYILHRLSGLVLLLFLMAHVVVSSSRLLGVEVWAQVLAMTRWPVVDLFEDLVFLAFAFHAFNGIRLLVVELGFALGRSERLVYPYRGSIHKQRPLLITMMVLAAALIVVGAFDVLRLSHY